MKNQEKRLRSFLKEVKKFLPEERVLEGGPGLYCYSYDATPFIPKKIPFAVLFPENTEEVSRITTLANELEIPLYPRGSGTSISGGPVPVDKGVVISFERMNKILEIDEENLTALVEPGVVVGVLDREVRKSGLMYPPDPGSVNVATIGGTVAENAGGLRAIKYGVTEHYVLGIEAVFPDGEVFNYGGKCIKNVTGYNFKGLFTSSEGTLAIFTKILLKLLPYPKYRKTIIAFFNRLEDAGQTVTDIIKSHVIPATLEIMDDFTVNAIRKYTQIDLPEGIKATLLIEVDGMGKDSVEWEAQKCEEAINKNQGTFKIAKDEKEKEIFWSGRRAAYPSVTKIKPFNILEDITVPRTKMAEILKEIQEIAKKYDLYIATLGHAGDGNLHPIILVDPKDRDELIRAEKAFDEILEKTRELGGTLSGEHGIGIGKLKYLPDFIGPAGIKVMQRIKKAFDPKIILNPGKLVPDLTK